MRSKWRVATTALPNESRLACLITIWKSDSYFVQTQQFHVIVSLKFARRKLFAKNCCTACGARVLSIVRMVTSNNPLIKKMFSQSNVKVDNLRRDI